MTNEIEKPLFIYVTDCFFNHKYEPEKFFNLDKPYTVEEFEKIINDNLKSTDSGPLALSIEIITNTGKKIYFDFSHYEGNPFVLKNKLKGKFDHLEKEVDNLGELYSYFNN